MVKIPILSSLCGNCSKKSSKSSYSRENSKKNEEITTEVLSNSPPSLSSQQLSTNNYGENNTTTNTDDDELLNKPLPPPPSATKLEFGESNVLMNKKLRKQTSNVIDKSSSLQNYLSKGSTRRKLSSSMSMKLPTKFKDKAHDIKDKAHDFKDKAQDKAHDFKDKAHDIKDKASEISHLKKKNEHESLWNKRIILGGKCKLPNNTQDDEAVNNDNDNDNNNNEQTTSDVGSTLPSFSRRTTQRLSSRVYSRSVSNMDHDTISSVNDQEDDKLTLDKVKGKKKMGFYDEDES